MPSGGEMITARAEGITASLVGGKEVLSLPTTSPPRYADLRFIYLYMYATAQSIGSPDNGSDATQFGRLVKSRKFPVVPQFEI
jgi:hypothetical protein